MKYVRSHLFATTLGLCSVLYCGGGVTSNDAGLDASDATSDAVVDGSSGPCTSGSFGAPIGITELNSTLDERGLRLTPDELTAVFSRGDTDDSGLPDKDTYIYLTTRSSTSSPFAAPLQLDALNNVLWGSVYPSVTADASAIFYESSCVSTITAVQSSYCLSVPYGDAAADFGYGIPLFDVQVQAFNDVGKFGIGFGAGDGFATRDGLGYYFVGPTVIDAGSSSDGSVGDAAPNDGAIDDSGSESGSLTYGIFASSEPTRSAGFFSAAPVFAPSDPAILVDDPVLSSDELTMFVSTTSATSAVPHIQSATRATTSDNFGPLTPSHELDSAEGEYPTWLSPDQCRLYLTRTVGGQTDIYVASRSPS